MYQSKLVALLYLRKKIRLLTKKIIKPPVFITYVTKYKIFLNPKELPPLP